MTTLIDELQAAWDDGELVFPKDPHAEQKRWFLRTGVPTTTQRTAMVIGMNPSTATELGLRRDGYRGDATTDKILKRFSARYLFYRLLEQKDDPIFSEVVFVNLIPHVGKPQSLPQWGDDTAKLPLKDSLPISKELWRIVLESVTDVILIWGNPNDKKYPWKKPVLNEMKPFLKAIANDKQLWAVMSQREPRFPYHPRYPKWARIRLERIAIDLEN